MPPIEQVFSTLYPVAAPLASPARNGYDVMAKEPGMKSLKDAIRVDKTIPIPLYYQLKKQLLDLIERGSLHEGDMISPENELCELLNVSRPTVRQAFSELVSEGYLVRYKGKGTFIAKPKQEEQFLSKLETFNNEMSSRGLVPHTQVLKLRKMLGPHEANERLGIPLDGQMVYLSRLRSADEVPLVYVETFLSCERFPALLELDFSKVSLYESLEKLYGIRITLARREIEAVNANRREAGLLNIGQGKAVCLVKTLGFSASSPSPIEFSIARYRGDATKFSLTTSR